MRVPDSGDAPAANDAAKLEALADEARAHRGANAEIVDSDGNRDDQAPGARPRRRRVTAPAEGERNAIVGYLGQYQLAAMRTLEALRGGTLSAVRVADVKAGQIDDFQLQTAERVDAHQVKWSRLPATIGFAEFVNDAKERTRYIRQLADGWERLSDLHRSRRVVVHFVTNDIASSNTNPSIPRPDESEHPAEMDRTWSFAAFLAEAWRPAVEAARAGTDPNDAVPSPWLPAMAALADASALDTETWRRFVADCELEFGVPSLKTSIESAPITEAERRVFQDDADRLTHGFMRLVARPDRREEFSREQLLDEVGWRFRAEFKHAHEFPDPEIPYRNIAETVREVTDAVDRHTRGYLAVIGSPGSGKSTLLTKTLRESPHRVVRYYAYVRGAVDGSLRRGEAVNFLYDLSVALDRTGLHVGTLPVDNLDLLTCRVHEQLKQASAERAAGGRRTIILVDGLDHIPREQRPTHSLLSHLPHPEDVPEGVLFVLGTQTDRLPSISPRIRDQVDEPGRRIVMRALERRDVLDIVEHTELVPAPTPEECERIFNLSGGHPLALNYIINRLRHASGVAVADTLGDVEPFSEGIDRQYATIWHTVDEDIDLASLLALLARVRGSVRLDWMRRWAPRQALHTITTRLHYLFSQEQGNRWTFFHNSFRAFLIERTRELPALGSDADLFAELAEHCAGAGALEPQPERADELYYRARAGDNARVLALANPESLRTYFVAGRSARTIRDDLALALDAAVSERDIVALTRILLCSAEFIQREYYADHVPLAETWLEFGDIDLALDALREGMSLRTPGKPALRAAAALDIRGFHAEGHQIFTLAEPLDVLRGKAREHPGQERGELDLLDAWIAVAARFRSVGLLVDMIQRSWTTANGVWTHDEDDQATADQKATTSRRYRLLARLAEALDALERWDDADSVRTTLHPCDGADAWWFRAQSTAWHDAMVGGEKRRAEARFAVLREAYETSEIPDSVLGPPGRVALASGYLWIAADKATARQLLVGVEQPDPIDYAYSEDGWAHFHARFALNRVLGALGDQRPLDQIVPDVPKQGRRGHWNEQTALARLFERAVAHLGRLAGQAWVAHRPTHSDFDTLVRIFSDNPSLSQGAGGAINARNEFYTRLVQVAADHGAEWTSELRRLFEVEWSDEVRREAWPNSLICTILTKLLSVGTPVAWVRTWLARVEPTVFRGENLENDVTDGVAQARAWVAAGDIVAGRATLGRVLRATFGVGPKDYQLLDCLAWAVAANVEDPASTPERLAQMAASVLSLDGAEAQNYIAARLLEAGIPAGAKPARALAEWMLRNDMNGWVDVLTILIDGFAERVPAAVGGLSSCYRSLVLPFAQKASVHTVVRLSAALRAAQDNQELDALVEAIEVVALGSTRPALREAVAGRLEDAEEILRNPTVYDSTAPRHVVEAFEGLTLTLSELQVRVQGVSDVEDLVRRLSPKAYGYRWELILAPFVARATADELFASAAAIPQNKDEWNILADIAGRLIALGDSRALEVVERVLRISHPAGWSEDYDHGSRVTAYELFVRLSPEGGRSHAWQALRNDIAAGEVAPFRVFGAWRRIVAILAPGTSASDIWEVVSRHVAELLEHGPHGETLSLPPAEDPCDHAAVADEVYGLIANYLDHHAIALAQGAQHFFADRLLAEDPAAVASLARRLADPDTPKHGALLVLRAFARVRGGVPVSIHNVLRTLLEAPSYSDRRAALGLLGLSVGATGSGAKPTIYLPLPAIFSLIHPAAPPPARRTLPARGAMLEAAKDTIDLVSIFRGELDLVADWANVQPEALYRYVADRATTRLPPGLHHHGFDEESALRDELRCLGLQITYRRPRPRRVERAMDEAIAMLFDSGRFDERYLPALDRLLRHDDPHFVIVRPSRRPPFVAPIPERTHSQYVESNWTAGVTANNAVTGRTVSSMGSDVSQGTENVGGAYTPAGGEWIVLAEETWLRWLDWKQATETRVGSRLEMASFTPGESAEEFLEPDDIDGNTEAGQALSSHIAELSFLTADEYLRRARVPHSIVIRNDTYRFETPGGPWLAFNPALAQHLGWLPAPDGQFRWLDAGGRIMAESIWWQDGFAEQRPPLPKDEVAHGWLVRVSISGWQLLAEVVGDCVDWHRVARLAQEQAPRHLVVHGSAWV